MIYVPFDAGGRPLRPRQRTARRRWLASINTPSSGGLGNFAAPRSRGMPQGGREKFLLNGVGATRRGPRRQVRVRRGCNGVRRSPREELMPKTFGLKVRLWQGGTFVASKAGVWLPREKQSGGYAFREA